MSELSETIGSYVQLREQDQVSMERLRERVMELDLENTQLTKAHVERLVSCCIERLCVYKHNDVKTLYP